VVVADLGHAMSKIEIIAAVITAISIWLATKENIWYWPTGIVSLVLYTWTFYQAKLYGETILQIVCLVLMIYGWYEWLFGGSQHTELPVTLTPRRAWLPLLVSGAAGSIGAALLMRRFTDNPSPWIDASILAFSLVAQLMTARKWLENWTLWIIINVISVFLYIKRHLYPTAVLYVVLLILAVAGYRQWKRSVASA
jgi:nicotinamide mononucleotide transporter